MVCCMHLAATRRRACTMCSSKRKYVKRGHFSAIVSGRIGIGRACGIANTVEKRPYGGWYSIARSLRAYRRTYGNTHIATYEPVYVTPMHAHSHAMQGAHSKLPRSALRDRKLDSRKTSSRRRADPATTRLRPRRATRRAHPHARRAATQRLEHHSRRPFASSLVLAGEVRESSASDEMRQRYGSRSARAHRREQRRCAHRSRLCLPQD